MNTPVNLLNLAQQVLQAADFEATLLPEAAQQLEDSGQLPSIANELAQADVRDLRSLFWTSIDNASSTDLDQIEYAERGTEGRIRLMVGIADVDFFVAKQTPLDRHAAINTTSIYTPVHVFSMLPEEISSGKSSLLAGQERLVTVADMTILQDGSVESSCFYRAVAINHAKLVYEEVAAWFDGTLPVKHASVPVDLLLKQLTLQYETAERIRSMFRRKGALTFETIESLPVAANGRIVRMESVNQNSARDIIQHFMILTNNQIARFLEDHGAQLIYRVVPPPARWDRIVELASRFNCTLPPEPNPRALSEFMWARKQAAPDQYRETSLAILKLMGRGKYSIKPEDGDNEGHFGLALEDYTHSTAPNRRYIDLVIQRILKGVLSGQTSAYTIGELAAIADHCTKRESEARKIDRKLKKAAAATLLMEHIGEVYQGIVTAVKTTGTFVRLLSPPVEGKVTRRESGIDVGDKVEVRLIEVDVSKGFIDFEIIRELQHQ